MNTGDRKNNEEEEIDKKSLAINKRKLIND